MKRRTLVVTILCAVATMIFVIGSRGVTATPQVLVPSPGTLRVRLVGNEPIATPDRRSILAGWEVLVFEDLDSSTCYLTFAHGSGVAVAGRVPCVGREEPR
jgi:hypothetical protein